MRASYYDPLSSEDMLRVRDRVFDENDVRDVTLYLAHTRYDRSIRSLAEQTKRKRKQIKKTIEYIRTQLKYAFEEAGLINSAYM